MLKVIIIISIIILAGCGGNTTGNITTGASDIVEIIPAQAVIREGEQQQFTAIYTDTATGDITTAPFDWVISDGNLAAIKIDPIDKGAVVVTGIKAGTVGITVTNIGYSKTASLTIKAADGSNSTKIEISPLKLSIPVGEQQEFFASLIDSNGNIISNANTSFDWTISDSNLAAIEVNSTNRSSSIVTGKQPGTSKVTVTYDGLSETASLVIRPVEVRMISPGEDAVLYPLRSYLNPFYTDEYYVSVMFTFSGDDTFQSTGLFLDGVDVTPDSALQQYDNSVYEGGISYKTNSFSPGSHQVIVEAKSKGGKTVTYNWSFSFDEMTGGGVFETIGYGTSSYIKDERYVVIRDEVSWNNLLKQHTSGNSPSIPIDFQKEMIIAIYLGERPSGGYWTRIKKVEDRIDKLIVYYEEVKPGCLYVTLTITYPFHMIKLSRTDKEVSFVKSERRECN